jgi:hypothetical protein
VQADGPEGGRATTARQGVGKNGRFEESEEDGRCSSFIVERSVRQISRFALPPRLFVFFYPILGLFLDSFQVFCRLLCTGTYSVLQ